MTKTALYVSVALLFGAAGAFAQGQSSQPDNKAPSAAQQASGGSASPSSQGNIAGALNLQTAADQVCAQDAAKYCSGESGAARRDCLQQNDAKPSDACKQAMETRTSRAH